MTQASFSSNISYTPGGGGSLSQSFGGLVSYHAINAGSCDVKDSVAEDHISIPFGSVGNASGLMVRNNAGTDIVLFFNNDPAAVGAVHAIDAVGGFQVPPGGVVMLWLPALPTTRALSRATALLVGAPSTTGAVDYIVLGD